MNSSDSYSPDFDREEIADLSSKRLIESVRPPLTNEAAHHIHQAIEFESRDLGKAHQAKRLFELALAEAKEQDNNERLAEQCQLLARAEDDLQHIKPSSLLLAAILSACALIAVGSEFALTSATLPFILSIPRWSVLGVMVSLAPPAALAILKIVIARLFEDPWNRIQSPGASAASRAAITALMVAFLVAVAWLNLHTIMRLQSAREEALAAKSILERTEDAAGLSVNQPVINAAVLAVSVAVTVDGALFFLFGFYEFQRYGKRKKASAKVAALRSQQETLRGRRFEAAARVRVATHACEASESEAELIAARFKQERLFQLEQTLVRLLSSRTALELVDDVLAASRRPAVDTHSGNNHPTSGFGSAPNSFGGVRQDN